MKTLLLILLLVPMMSFGQAPGIEWENTFTTNGVNLTGRFVQQTNDGGYIITGGNNSTLILIKTNSSGTEEWRYTYGGSGNNALGRCVRQTSNGGYIITGLVNNSLSGSDLLIIKVDANGIEEWAQSYGGSGQDVGNSIQETSDGAFIVCGYTNSFSNTTPNFYLLKINSFGQLLWENDFGGGGSDMGMAVEQTTDGGYIITGSGNSIGVGPDDIYLIKTDSNGSQEWFKNYGAIADTAFVSYNVEQTSDGGYIVSGDKNYWANNSWDIVLLKLDTLGDIEWEQTFGNLMDSETLGFVQQTNDGGYIISGTKGVSGATNNNVWLIKTDINGLEEWSWEYVGVSDDYGWCVQQTSDGGYVSTGSKGDELYLLKLNGHGNASNTTIPLPSSNKQLIKIVDVLGRETPFKPNTPLLYIYNDGTVERKMIIKE